MSFTTDDLIVRDPVESDAGVYECRAVSAAGAHSQTSNATLASEYLISSIKDK